MSVNYAQIAAEIAADADEIAEIATIFRAIKASGAIIKMAPQDFLEILSRTHKPLIVVDRQRHDSGFLSTPVYSYQYLTGYKGLIFYTHTKTKLQLPVDVELVKAKEMWIPC